MLSLFKYLRLVSIQIDLPDSKLYFTARQSTLNEMSRLNKSRAQYSRGSREGHFVQKLTRFY